MSQRGLAPIIIVLLITAAIGGYLVYFGKINLPQRQDTAQIPVDETADWKEYKNPDFSLKYPNNWELKDYEGFVDKIHNEEGDEILIVYNKLTPLDDSDCNDLFDKMINNKGERFDTVEGGLEFGFNADGKISKRLAKKDSLVLNDRSWEYFIRDDKELPLAEEIPTINTCTEQDNILYLISFIDHSELKDFDLYTKILSTFQVSQSNNTIDWKTTETADWKTYTSSNLGFSVKYPLNLKIIEEKDGVFFSGNAAESFSVTVLDSSIVTQERIQELYGDFGFHDKVPKYTTTEIVLDGIKATEYFGCAGVEGCQDTYFIIAEKDNKIYQLSYNVPFFEKNQYRLIISTFRFNLPTN